MQLSFKRLLSFTPAAETETLMLFLPRFRPDDATFKGTVTCWSVVHTFVVAGSRTSRLACREPSSGELDAPETVASSTSAGVQLGNAGSAFLRHTSMSKTHSLLTTPSRSQPASPSRQRTSL